MSPDFRDCMIVLDQAPLEGIFPMIRVLIADDSPAIRDGLSSLIDAQSDFIVVGTAGDGIEAVEKAKDLRPDVVIMDAQMPKMDGVEATSKLKRDFPTIGILFLSTFSDHIEAARTAGCDGYLTKDCGPIQLYAEVRRIAASPKSSE